MPEIILFFDVSVHTRHHEQAGLVISGIERVCLEELKTIVQNDKFKLYLYSSRGDERYISYLIENLSFLKNTKIFQLPSYRIAASLLRKPVSLLVHLLERMGNLGCKHLLPPFLPFLIKLWSLGTIKVSSLPEFKNRKLICYSPFRAYPPCFYIDKNIRKAALIHDIIPLRYVPFPSREYWGYLIDFSLFARYSDLLFFMSKFTRQDFQEFFPEARQPSAITYGAASNNFYPRSSEENAQIRRNYGIAENSFCFLSVASSGKRKNLEALLHGFLELKQLFPQDALTLLLVGPAGLEFQTPATHNLGIIATGFVPDQDIPLLYSASSCFCFFSHYEGFGLPVLEAFASGLPVICSNNSSVGEIAGNAAFLIDPTSSQDILDAMKKVYLDSELQAKLRQAGLARAKGFSWQTHCQILLKNLAQL